MKIKSDYFLARFFYFETLQIDIQSGCIVVFFTNVLLKLKCIHHEFAFKNKNKTVLTEKLWCFQNPGYLLTVKNTGLKTTN